MEEGWWISETWWVKGRRGWIMLYAEELGAYGTSAEDRRKSKVPHALRGMCLRIMFSRLWLNSR